MVDFKNDERTSVDIEVGLLEACFYVPNCLEFLVVDARCVS